MLSSNMCNADYEAGSTQQSILGLKGATIRSSCCPLNSHGVCAAPYVCSQIHRGDTGPTEGPARAQGMGWGLEKVQEQEASQQCLKRKVMKRRKHGGQTALSLSLTLLGSGTMLAHAYHGFPAYGTAPYTPSTSTHVCSVTATISLCPWLSESRRAYTQRAAALAIGDAEALEAEGRQSVSGRGETRRPSSKQQTVRETVRSTGIRRRENVEGGGAVAEDDGPVRPSAGAAERSRQKYWRLLEQALRELDEAEPAAPYSMYESVLRLCGKLGDCDRGLKVLRRMRSPPRVAYNLVLQAAAAAGNRALATELYEEMVAPGGVGVNVFSYSPLMTLCAKQADGQGAIDLLEDMGRKNVYGNAFTYTAAIDACERAGMLSMTPRLIEKMRHGGVKPTTVTYNTIIARRAEREETWAQSLQWLAQLEASGLPPTRSSYSAAMNACEKAEEWGLVVELATRAGPLADATMWSRAFNALLWQERYDEVLSTMEALQEEGAVRFDEVMYTMAIKACGPRGKVPQALAMMEQMRREGLKPNVVTYSAAIEACKEGQDWETGLQLLAEMKACGVKPNAVTYSSLLDTLSEAGQWERALKVFRSLDNEGLKKNVWLYTAAIRACAKGQQVDTALQLLDEALRVTGTLDEKAVLCLYTGVLDACEKAGDGSMALRVLDQVWREHRIRPDEVACGAVISACRKAGMVTECLKLLAFMVNNKMSPNLGVYNTVLGALSNRPETLDKAVKILLFMQNTKSGQRPNVNSYAQVIHGMADNMRWRESLDLLEEMRKAGLRPDVLTCAKVIRACERSKRWKDALELLDEMRRDNYSFYELEVLDGVFKKLLEAAAAGVRAVSGPGQAKGIVADEGLGDEATVFKDSA